MQSNVIRDSNDRRSFIYKKKRLIQASTCSVCEKFISNKISPPNRIRNNRVESKVWKILSHGLKLQLFARLI